ncbi:response regulator transcription factor [Yaniella flava]|uniref:Response regulator transcription factor n=1 Tax=Yaniella flava TaxID=287930 RepID=A0ABN2UTH7_9MICC|nr:response regulator transcription factor [Micrococcaceae bacterium]
MISVVLVDDQDLVRAGLRTLLSLDPEIFVAAEASDGQQAITAARVHRPDVMLMDIRMPVFDGIAATHQMSQEAELDGVRVVILTTFDDDEDIVDAVKAGAAGYLLKDAGAYELRKAIHTVADGGNLLSPQITRKLMEAVASQPATDHVEYVDLSDLTEREMDILGHVAQGATNSEIAASLFLSPATVRTYVSRILTKLDARDRTELAILAHRAGLHSE